MASVQLAAPPPATRTTHVPAVRLRRYPSPTPGPVLTKMGFFAIGSFRRDVRVSRFDARIRRGIHISPFEWVSRECPGDGRRHIWVQTDVEARSMSTLQRVIR